MKQEQNKFFISHPSKGTISSHELDENEALLILSSFPALGSVRIRQLKQHYGSALKALHADDTEIALLPGFGTKIAAQWPQWPHSEEWKRNLALVERAGVQLIGINSPLYPIRLKDLLDPPHLLYAQGDLSKLKKPCIAIIGTRQASVYGTEMALHFAKELAHAGFVIISGLARGIDTAAHRGALSSGDTAAVIGSGLANIYPAENQQLAKTICSQGFLISEFPMATPPDRQNFPQRNRIVAALSEAIFLVEAPFKSGAMLTMQNGLALRRQLFALPGRADNKNFCGNHALIKNRQAELVESPNDILAHLDDQFNLFDKVDFPPKQSKSLIQLDKEEAKLLQLLPTEELPIDQIANQCQIPISSLHILLMSLVLKGAIKEFPGKVFKKTGI